MVTRKIPWLILKMIPLLLLLYSVSVHALGSSANSKISCKPVSEYHYKTLDNDLSSIQFLIENNSLFAYAKENFNKFPTCQYENDDTGLLLIYQFNKSVVLKNLSNPSIEFNSATLSLPSNSQLREENAVAMLQSIEGKSFGEKGCGIKWNKPVVENSKDNSTIQKAWWGETCNCKGDIVFKNTKIIQLSFQTAC